MLKADIRLSGYRVMDIWISGYPVFLLISRYPDNHYRITRSPDNQFLDHRS